MANGLLLRLAGGFRQDKTCFLRRWTSTNVIGGTCDRSKIPKQKEDGITPATISEMATKEKIETISCDDELQPQWQSLEARMLRKKTKSKGYGGPEGRSFRNPSAWDAEHV